MNQNYELIKPYVKVSKGSLSFTRITKEKLPVEIEQLKNLIKVRMQPVSIIDIMVDVDKLTGFLDVFETVGYKEGMTREEKAKRLVATLL